VSEQAKVDRVVEMMLDSTVDLARLPWRVGRKRGRNVYAVRQWVRKERGFGMDYADDDHEVAKFDDERVARYVVRMHNLSLHAQLGEIRDKT
jgi:hypothetical protein